MLAGLMIVVPIWLIAYAPDWHPHGIVIAVIIGICITGIMVLYDELTDIGSAARHRSCLRR